MSGTVRTHVDVGVPQLPGATSGATGPLGILLSDQTWKVWRSPDGVRVAQMLPSAERDVVVTRADVWIWDSLRFAAWHGTVAPSATPSDAPSPADLDALVSKSLSRLAPYADVTSGAPAEVVGRAAYVIRLTPASSSATLVGRVEVAIDAQTRVPLRLRVFARDVADPVVDLAYTDVSFGAVDPAIFSFTPPAGASVHELTDRVEADGGGDVPAAMSGVRVFGTGFDLVLAVPVPSVPKDAGTLLPYAGPLGSADVVRRGGRTWVVAGLVPPDALAKVEARLP
jgi:outer membrane lipoprotein-sorting protein